ncbi:MAG: hypothetical protein LUQ59_05125, partial [Methanothrix sp.]|nr:hypothetical protein [Methanothrix sp.]
MKLKKRYPYSITSDGYSLFGSFLGIGLAGQLFFLLSRTGSSISDKSAPHMLDRVPCFCDFLPTLKDGASCFAEPTLTRTIWSRPEVDSPQAIPLSPRVKDLGSKIRF